MIHHLSIHAGDPRHVASVLVEMFGGTLTGFGPYPDSFIAWLGDEHGTAIELPRGPNHVIEFWIENSVMLELMTPEMARDYMAAMRHFRTRDAPR